MPLSQKGTAMPDYVIEHEQLDIHAGPPTHPLGRLGAAYPCAVPGISLTDYSKNPEGKGWGPHCTGPFTKITLSNGTALTCDARIAELVTLILNETIRRGYDVRQADTGCYNCRYISGTTVWSNHAWGLAVDVNWQSNPQHSPLISDQPTWLLQLWNRYGFAWGGDYTPPTVPDAMHHEFMGTPDQAVAATNLARSELAGAAPAPAPAPLQLPAARQSPITGNMEVPGFDASYSRPSAVAMGAAGYTFMIGYVSPTVGKNLNSQDMNAYLANGVAIGLVWESTAGRALQGSAAGSTDGAAADAQADALLYPVDSVIFFAVDQDTTSADDAALQAYATAFNMATKRPVGVYGEADVVDALVTPGQQPVQYGWQTAAWSGVRISSKAHLYQRVGHPGWPVPAGTASNSFDEDVALAPLPLSGWAGTVQPAPAPPPPPPPPANPGKFVWPLPLGDYYGNILGNSHCHGGYYASERDEVANIQRWLVYHGCTSVASGRWATTTWADGKWTAETDTAMGVWHDRFYGGQQYRLRCYRDDYDRLAVA